MRKIKINNSNISLFLLITISAMVSSFTYNDIDKFLGRWGYVKIYNNNIQNDEQFINPGVFSVDLKVQDALTSVYAGAFIDLQDMANKWTVANGHLVLNVLNGGPIAYAPNPDNQNVMYLDQTGNVIDPLDIGVLGYTKAKLLDYTHSSFCNAQTLEFKEIDIFLHAHVPPSQSWVRLNVTNITAGCTEMDLRTVAVHEMGHFIGLGHSVGAAANHMVMTPALFFCDLKSLLTADDVQAAHDLYNPGPDGLGIIPCNKFAKNYGEVSTKCMTVQQQWLNASEEMQQNCKNNNCKSGGCRVLYIDGEGSIVFFSQSCKNYYYDFTNNFGLSVSAIANINTFISTEDSLNFKRYKRHLLAYMENAHEVNQFFIGYEDHLIYKGLHDSSYLAYIPLFEACDNFINEFMPLIDATFRCEYNTLNPELNLTLQQVELIDNILDEVIAMGPKANLLNEAIFLKSQLPNFVGKNFKTAYRLFFKLNDPLL